MEVEGTIPKSSSSGKIQRIFRGADKRMEEGEGVFFSITLSVCVTVRGSGGPF